MQQRQLTQGEREMLAHACYTVAEEARVDADRLLQQFPKDEVFQMMYELSEESASKLERLAGTVVARYRALRRTQHRYQTLAEFLVRPSNVVTVDCLILIPEQA